MNTIHLSKAAKPTSQSSLLKRCALTVFKTVRSVAEQGKKAPSALAQSFTEVRDAWVETRPNV
ncbi:MAG: hypothetical protein IPM27_02375 [Nitrosomonadales bacterium]|nr:hypothetical protein [Nitrosomonadales bacterium]